jgi:exopolysaccharide biosynthesis polyprenyl glycosylphosphotransferase
VIQEPEPLRPVEDVRAGRPYLLSPSWFRSLLRRVASIAALVVVDLCGLVVGLYAALALRAFIFDPKPVLWGLLWDQETNWLPFLILLLVLVFARAGLYAHREVREGAGRVFANVVLVALLSLAFAIGTGQHFTTFGLYVVGTIFVGTLIGLCRASYEGVTRAILHSAGVRRKVALVGHPEARDHLRDALGATRSGIYYDFAAECEPDGIGPVLAREQLDEILVADSGLDDQRLLRIVDEAHSHGVKVRVAPRTTELLLERGKYVPGRGVLLFDLRPPILAGADWATKRTFDVVVAAAIIAVGLPLWLLVALAVKLSSRGPVFYADTRVGLGEQEFRMLKFRTMVAGADRQKAGLERVNEAGGALFKIRDDPRVTRVGRFLRRFSLDEIPNVINVLRGEMSLVGPRPLPTRDFALLEPWHRRRYNVLPGMTGLWQVSGRSDLTFDDLVRLDFYYLENWSIWLDMTILFKTPFVVVARRGAY